MTEFSELMRGVVRNGDGWTVKVSDDWKQGRTIYGGLAAALCAQAALNEWPDLPPLRSATFSFAGPAEGALRLAPSMLRRGKSTVYATVDLSGEAGHATRATFAFGAARTGSINYSNLPMPQVRLPEQCQNFFDRAPPMLKFLQHLEGRFAAGSPPFMGGREPSFTLWLRHRDPSLLPSIVSLLALADAPPPPAAALAKRPPKAISTMTWTVDMLTDHVVSSDGWWLTTLTAETISDGYETHSAWVWSSDGRPAIAARQHVAVFE